MHATVRRFAHRHPVAILPTRRAAPVPWLAPPVTLTVLVALVLVLVALVLVVTVDPAYAQSAQAPQVASSVDQVLTNIRNWIMGILGALATVFLSIGGVRYVLAGGDPGEVEKAKQSFRSAGWGYGLAALAPLVVEILRGIVEA